MPRLSKHGAGFFNRPLAAALSLATVLAGTPAIAHLPAIRGKLVELVQRSDLIVIGSADRVIPVGTSLVDTTVTIAEVLAGTADEKHLTFRGPTRFAPGERYVFFLHRTPDGFAAQQDSGTVFPCTAADDAIYRSTVQALSHALQSDVAARPDAIRAALLPALTAMSDPLRYSAALELVSLAQSGHPPTLAERARIEQLLHDKATDPALQPLLNALLRFAAPAAVATPAAPNRLDSQ